MSAPAVVIGAGLAGLACARHLARAGRDVVLLEASDDVGGRVRTDAVDGFLLDRGFQVLLTAYPEARAQLDCAALDLRPFAAGAVIRWQGGWHKVADPTRQPLDALGALAGPIGTFGDKLKVLELRREAMRGTLDELFARPEETTAARLHRLGFSDAMVERFLRPFLAGIFLDSTLSTSSRMLEFVFRMMAEGDTAIPARGMGELPRQLAAGLPAGTVRLGTEARAVTPGRVTLADGSTLEASTIVVATEGDVAARLTGRLPEPRGRSVCVVYYSAPAAPMAGPWLMLDGDGAGPVNNAAVLSELSPHYAPAGRALVAASVLGLPAQDDEGLDRAVRAQLAGWFGPGVQGWRHLRTYRVRWAQPDQTPPALEPAERPVVLGEGLLVAGDHRATSSIHGALLSGRHAAEAILAG